MFQSSSSNANSPSARRRNSCGSLEVLPNNSPAQSDQMEDQDLDHDQEETEKEKEVLTSGIESEILSNNDSEPPTKLYISQAPGGESWVV